MFLIRSILLLLSLILIIYAIRIIINSEASDEARKRQREDDLKK